MSAAGTARLGIIAMMLALASCASAPDPDRADVQSNACARIGEVPDPIRRDFSLNPFYEKYADANGLPVLSSADPDDAALERACKLAVNMLSHRPDVRAKLIELRARFVVIGRHEGTADIPEYGFRDKSQQERDAINARARGLGGQAASCGEENLMCQSGDRYPTESICVHEFSHTIGQGVYELDHGFGDRLQHAFDAAKASGILDESYRAENPDEYWAEGVQDWYGTNAQSSPPDGVHNAVNTRRELEAFDPRLSALIGEVFPTDTDWHDCHVGDE
ncbi:hypothetical protein [Pseudoxanthomonas yeongjuensis]|uniref:hypothetical protein n=1 Tax=Pseudoxanthomonas yeongjuensis TaxID=377616 RepID=UPI001391E144|nr:hypothetical protein [Pseudoxanthomonas yeongjuensis]